MAAKSIWVIAHLTARPDRIDEVRRALTGLIEATRAEDGCIRYELTQNNSDPVDFTFVEEWTDDESLNKHLESGHIRDLQSRAVELFAAPPDIRRYTLLA
jgi:quinol monooxygenase YgiN